MNPIKRLLLKIRGSDMNETKPVKTQTQQKTKKVSNDNFKILNYIEDDSKLHRDITRNTLAYLCNRLEPFEEVKIECKADSMAYFIRKHYASSHVLAEYFGKHLYRNMLQIIQEKKTPIGYVKSENYTGYFKIHIEDEYEEINEYNHLISKELYEFHFQDVTHIFYKKRIVIKGKLHQLTEEKIKECFLKIAAVLDASLSINTDYLVIGNADKADYSEIEQIAKGLGIPVLSEDAFIHFLKS